MTPEERKLLTRELGLELRRHFCVTGESARIIVTANPDTVAAVAVNFVAGFLAGQAAHQETQP